MTDLDWISFSAAQSFPLADSARGVSQQEVQIPNSLILGIRIVVTPPSGGIDMAGFYIKGINDHGTKLDIIFGYNGYQCAACYGIPKIFGISEPLNSRYFSIVPSNVQNTQWISTITGSVIVGVTKTYQYGSLTFIQSQTAINPLCISTAGNQGVQAIIVGGTRLTGDITIQPGQGILISVKDNTIKIQVDQAYIDNLVRNNTVQQVVQTYGPPIQSINGVRPDNAGNITLTGLDCVQVSPLSGAGFITISNPCSKPCCDSSDTDALSTNLQVLQSQQQLLRDYFVSLSTSINYMQANLSTLMNQR